MANPHRGEVAFDLAGEQYTLRIATNEWCALEEEHGELTTDLLVRFQAMVSNNRLDMRFVRSFFKAALEHCRPGISLEDAGEIMTGLSLVEAAKKLGQAIALSLPSADEDEDKNPPAARRKAGNGKRSIPPSPRLATTPKPSGG